jgi:hypothetical protein
MHFTTQQPAIFTERTGSGRQQTVHRSQETTIGNSGGIPVARS